MIESTVFHSMALHASLSKNDVTLDIGAGLGFLTRFLADRCRCVLAVESDVRLVDVLREELGSSSNIQIIEGDVLKVNIPQFDKVVSIPPYYISSSLLLWLLEKDVDCAILIFQNEFADRLVASIGSEDYSWLTVVTNYYAETELLDEIPKGSFYPQPKVDSIIVRLKPKRPPPFDLKSKTLFKQLVQSLFTQRNRKIKNALLPFLESKNVSNIRKNVKPIDSLPFQGKRVRELAPEDFGDLANALTV